MTSKRLALAVGAAAAVIGCTAAIAYAATSHATVKIVLAPNANAGTNFGYTVKGTFKKSALTGPHPRRAYVIGLKQPAIYPCRLTEPADWLKVGPSRRAFHVTPSSSPFSFHRFWAVPATIGRYRFCVYVYSQPFNTLGHSGAAKELARFGISFPA